MKKSKSGKKMNIRRKLVLLLCLVFVITSVSTGSDVMGEMPGVTIADSPRIVLADDEISVTDKLPGVSFSSINSSYITDGMILMGAYLIHKDYMNESIYNLAVASMSQYNQPIFYYKSSLAGGKWVDVFSAASLDELRGTTGETVNQSALKDYKVCAVIYGDGVMEAVGGDNRNIYNITNPYDFKNLKEISVLATLFEGIKIDDLYFDDGVVKSDKNKMSDVYMKLWTGRYLFGAIEGDTNGAAFTKAVGDGTNETTKKMDECIDSMRGIYSYLVSNGYSSEYLSAMMEAMGQADSTRRAEMYYMLAFNGAGKIYDDIVNRRYGNLMTKYEWAEEFMINNWGPDWRQNDKWSSVIDEVVQKNDRRTRWTSVDYGNVERTIAAEYSKKYNIHQDTIAALNFSSGTNRKGVFASNYLGVGWINAVLAAYLTISRKDMGEWAAGMAYKNLIDKSDKNYYTIVYLATDYAWAVNQAGDRLSDVRYWADKGNYQMAYNNYMSMIQRTGLTREGAPDFNSDNYLVPGSGRLNDLLDRVSSGRDLDDDDRKTYTPNAEYIDAIKNAIQECEESYYIYDSVIVKPDNTILGNAKYQTINFLVENAKTAGNESSVSQNYIDALVEYTTIKNVMSDVISNRDRELTYVTNTLIPATERNYTAALYANPSDLYFAALNEGAPEDTVKGYLSSQKSELDGKLAQHEFAVQARVKRLPLGTRIAYIDQLINTADGYRNSITDTAFKEKANTSVDEYIQWLNSLKKTILGGSSGDSELDGLNSQKAAFMDAYLDALDEGNLDAAGDYKNALDDLLSKISDIQDGALNDFIDANASDASDALNKLKGTDKDLADQLLNKAMMEIDNGGDDVGAYIDALEELGDKDGLSKLRGKLSDAGAGDGLINSVDKAMKNIDKNNSEDADGNGDGSGNGKGGKNGDGTGGNGTGNGGNGDDDGNGNGGNGDDDGTGRNGGEGDDSGNRGDGLDNVGDYGNRDDSIYDGLNDLINRLGSDFDDMSNADKVAVIIGLLGYDGLNAELARRLAMLLLDQLLSEGNPFIYEKYHGTETDFLCVNLKAVDRCMEFSGFRYVLKDGLHTMSQINGSASYIFEDGLATVLKSDGKRENINISPRSQTDVTIDKYEIKKFPYITKEDSEQYLNVSCYYIPETIYAVIKTDSMDEKAQQLLELLERAYGD